MGATKETVSLTHAHNGQVLENYPAARAVLVRCGRLHSPHIIERHKARNAGTPGGSREEAGAHPEQIEDEKLRHEGLGPGSPRLAPQGSD